VDVTTRKDVKCEVCQTGTGETAGKTSASLLTHPPASCADKEITLPYKDKAKQCEYQRRRYHERRQQWLKENGPCKHCGSWIDLEVDHVDPESKIDHKVWSWSQQRRDAELAKCQVLCRKCHEKKTAEENSVPFEHGITGYKRKGCRCKKCRKANSTWCANYRAKVGRKDYRTVVIPPAQDTVVAYQVQ
jgi:hypothetical protein